MTSKTPKWKRAGPNGELEIKFPTGRRFMIEKQYDYNDRHKGDWMVKEWIKGDWEWVDTYSPKWYAKENVMRMGQYDKNRKKVADYSSTFQSESTIYESYQLEEGVNDPAIFKAVFLAGGPGSGKSFIVGKTALTALGMKVVNSDDAFEIGLKKAGLEMTPDNIYSPKGQEIRGRAKQITKNKQQLYLNGRLGMVIDGTGKDYDKIVMQAIALRKLGYDTAMIFVNTDEETALKRNRMRARSLPDNTVSNMWKGVQKNLGKFQAFFGDTMFIVDNSEGSDYEKQVNSVYRKMKTWTKSLPKNMAVTSWMKAQKNIKEEAPPATSIGNQSVALPPTAKFKPKVVVDRRRRKDKHPVLLKRFRKYMEDNNG